MLNLFYLSVMFLSGMVFAMHLRLASTQHGPSESNASQAICFAAQDPITVWSDIIVPPNIIVPGTRISGNSRKSGYAEIQKSGYPEIRTSGNPDIRISGFPDVRISGNPGVRISGYPDFRLSGSGYPDFCRPRAVHPSIVSLRFQ